MLFIVDFTILPCVMHFISEDFFFIRFKPDTKFHRLTVSLQEGVRFLNNLPIYPAIEVLDHS